VRPASPKGGGPSSRISAPGRAVPSEWEARAVTREEVQQVELRLRKRYPQGTVNVTRVFGGVEVEASDAGESVFVRAADDSPLLALLGATPDYRDPA
jgi:hypothetical protein